MPAHHDVGGCTRALAGRPRLGCERHADTEFAAQPNPGDGAVSDQIPVASCQSTKSSEYGEYQDSPRQNPDSPKVVAHRSKNQSACNSPEHRPRDERTCLSACQS